MALVKNTKSTIKQEIGNSVFHSSHSGKEQGYSLHGKQIIKENPGILAGFDKVVTERLYFYKDPLGRFSIKQEKPRNNTNTNSVYIVTIGTKYFIKESNDRNPDRCYSFDIKYRHGRDGISEHKAIELIAQEKDVKVISAHLSFVDPNRKVSFITSDFSQLKTIDDLLREDKITTVRYKNLKKQIEDLEKRINSKFHKFGLDQY